MHLRPLVAATLVVSPSLLAFALLSSARPWEHESSDVPVDPRIHFAALDNGMRYAWTDQSKSEDHRVSLRLHVDVGSLVESDAEQGMAHFIEHMAFNGTRNFKANTLVETFNKEGIQFGHDVNAHTSTDETVYELDLPDASAERLKKAFTWFRDVADGLLLEEKEVQGEKGVINAEERDRNSVGLRIYQRIEAELAAGTLWPKRWPIGVKSVRDKFNSAACKAFYKKWYRPEHMTFLVSGALNGADVDALTRETFASFAIPKDPLPKRPAPGSPKAGPKQFCVYDKEADAVTLVVGKLKPWQDDPDRLATRRQEFVRDQAIGLLNARLAEIAKKGTSYRRCGYGAYSVDRAVEGFALEISCEPAKWKEALTAARADFESILKKSFAHDEVRGLLERLNTALTSEPDAALAPGQFYVAKLLAACGSRFVPMDDTASNKLLLKEMPELKEERLDRELVASWNSGDLCIFAAGNLDLGKEGGKELRAAWDAADPAAASAAPTADAGAPKPKPGEPMPKGGEEDDPEAAVWTYRAGGAEGKAARLERDEPLRIARLEYENGVRATVRIDERPGGAAIIARLGSGFLALEPDESDVGWVASRIFLQSGLADCDYDQMVKLQKGRQMQFGFSVGLDALLFSGACGPADFQRLCEIFCAYVKDAGWRPEAFEKFKKDLPETYAAFERGFEGPLGEFSKLLHKGDHRFCVPDRAQVDSFLLDTIKEFVQPQLDDGPIELTVVTGGFDPGPALARTFGMLGKRGAPDAHEERRKTPPIQPGLKFRKEIETADKKALVRVVYPATDGRDAKVRRRLALLTEIVDDRMRVEIREKRGAAYSPSVGLDAGTVFPGLGAVEITITVDPAKAEEILNAVLAAIEALDKSGIKQDDLDRVKKVILTKLDQAQAEPGWWLSALDGSYDRPEVLADLKDVKAGYSAITADELTALARQYLVRKNASTCVVTPKKAAPPKK
jgi:zinc protease